MKPFFYRLLGDNPYWHFAAEDFLLRHGQASGMAVWVSRPTIVMGRFQNPWKEVYWQKLKEKDITLARRQSGGGTIYQDGGNLNFSFFGDLKYFDKRKNLDLVVASLKRLYLEVEQNDRHDLIVKKDGQSFKVSGNAFKQTKDRFLHHGTLLLNVDLDFLRYFLKPLDWKLKTKAVPSKFSPVMNLNSFFNQFDQPLLDIVMDSLEKEFTDYWGTMGVKNVNIREQHSQKIGNLKSYKYFSSTAWIWEETPHFDWICDDIQFHFEKGRLKKVDGPKSKQFEPFYGLAPWELEKVELTLKQVSGCEGQYLKNFIK